MNIEKLRQNINIIDDKIIKLLEDRDGKKFNNINIMSKQRR